MGVRKFGKRWGIDYSDHLGIRKREVCCDTKQEAKELLLLRLAAVRVKKAELARAKIADTPVPPDPRITHRAPVWTLRDAKVHWLKARAHKRSLDADRARWRFLEVFFGYDRDVSTITTTDVQDFRLWLEKFVSGRTKRPLEPATINRTLVLAKAVFRELVLLPRRERPIEESPFARTRLLTEDNKRDRILSPEELQRLLKYASPHLRLACLLSYQTGMSEGEICDLEWNDVNLKAGELHVYRRKTRVERWVPISGAVIEEFKRWETLCPKSKDDPRVLKVDAVNFSAQFARLAKRAGISDFKFHDFRHTALTNLRRSGADIMTLAKVVGHKTLAMVMRYQTIDTTDTRRAMSKIWKEEQEE